MAFAIVQECTVTGRKHYVYGDAITGMAGGCPERMTFGTAEAADQARAKFWGKNATDVERTKRQRKYRIHPCYYTVVEV